MQTVDTILWCTGALVWAALAIYLLMVLYELGKATCIAMDWMRWRLTLCQRHGLQVHWERVPRVFFDRVMDFFCFVDGSKTWSGWNGSWTGFRKWSINEPGKAVNKACWPENALPTKTSSTESAKS